MFSGARRKAGKEFLEIPVKYKGSEFHTWLSVVSDDRMKISKSNYVGLITHLASIESGLFICSKEDCPRFPFTTPVYSVLPLL